MANNSTTVHPAIDLGVLSRLAYTTGVELDATVLARLGRESLHRRLLVSELLAVLVSQATAQTLPPPESLAPPATPDTEPPPLTLTVRQRFAFLQAQLASACNVSPRAIRPSTHLDAILPRKRRRAWRKLAPDLGTPLPELVLSRSLRRAYAIIWVCVIMLGVVSFTGIASAFARLLGWSNNPDLVDSIFKGSTIAAVLFLMLCSDALQRPFRTRLPDGMRTVRDLFRSHLFALAFLKLKQPHDPATLWFILREVLAESIDARPHDIRLDTPLEWNFAQPCIHCNYDLRNADTRCPECGTPTHDEPLPEHLAQHLQTVPSSFAGRREYVAYCVRRGILGGGTFLLVTSAAVFFLRKYPLAIILAAVGLWAMAGEAFRKERHQPWLWAKVPCPGCNRPLRHRSILDALFVPFSDDELEEQEPRWMGVLLCDDCHLRFAVPVPAVPTGQTADQNTSNSTTSPG